MASLLERTRTPLFAASRAPAGRGEALLTAAAPPAWVRLNLTVRRQLQDQWCWAAVSASIAQYYGATGWTQCSVVNAELDQETCCVDGSSRQCNRPWYLDRALRRVDTFRRKESGAPDDLDDVQRQIDRGRPVGVRIGWSGGGGHFVAIEGYREDGDAVAVEDPWYGASDVPLDTFLERYQGTGGWTHTYYTRKP